VAPEILSGGASENVALASRSSPLDSSLQQE